MDGPRRGIGGGAGPSCLLPLPRRMYVYTANGPLVVNCARERSLVICDGLVGWEKEALVGD